MCRTHIINAHGFPESPQAEVAEPFGRITRACVLRHVGDVTVVLSKRGRNLGPKQTKILVTNLAELTPSQVVCIYQKRWAIELLHWELKSGLGLGEHQVSGDKDRSEKSAGHRGAGLLVCAARVSSRDRPWQILEYLSAAACVAVTGHDEPSRA